MPIKVSVVVPVYNPGEYFEPCIASLLKQSLPPTELELIFVDDGSTDQTPARLDQLAREHPHVKVIHQENSGWPGQPRNAGTDAATGEYVHYVDADDEMPEEALERLYAFARRNDSDIVIGKQVGDGRHVPVGLFRRNRDRATVHDSPIITSLKPHKMFRRAFLAEAGLRFPEGRVRLEDQRFVVAAYFAARTISVLSDYVCYVHKSRSDHGNIGATHTAPSDYFNDLRSVLDIVDANTDPGPERDRLHRRWLRWAMVGRMRGRRLLRKDEEWRQQLFDAIRPVVLTRFSAGVDAGLRPMDRLVAALIRRGDLEALLELARWEVGLRLAVHLTEARWRDGALVLAVRAELVDPDGNPVPLRESSAGRAIAPPLRGELLAELPPEILVEEAPVRLEIVARHVRTGAERFLPPRSRHQDDHAVAASVRGHLTSGRNGPGLAEGVWDVSVRYWAYGWNITTPVARLPGVATLPLEPSRAGRGGQELLPFWNASGQLSIKVGPVDRRNKEKPFAVASLMYRLLDRLPHTVARRLRGLVRRIRAVGHKRPVPSTRGRRPS